MTHEGADGSRGNPMNAARLSSHSALTTGRLAGLERAQIPTRGRLGTSFRNQFDEQYEESRSTIKHPRNQPADKLTKALWFWAENASIVDLPLLTNLWKPYNVRILREKQLEPVARAATDRAQERRSLLRQKVFAVTLPSEQECAEITSDIRHASKEDLPWLQGIVSSRVVSYRFRGPALQRLAELAREVSTLELLYRLTDYRNEPNEHVRVRAIESHRWLRQQLKEQGEVVPSKHFAAYPTANDDPSLAAQFLLADDDEDE